MRNSGCRALLVALILMAARAHAAVAIVAFETVSQFATNIRRAGELDRPCSSMPACSRGRLGPRCRSSGR